MIIVFWTYFDTLINVLTAELELSFIDTGSFQGQVHGQVLQIVDIFMCQTLKYLNIDCLILIMTVTCKNNLHCKYHKLFPPCVAPEPKWKMTCPACAAVLVLPPSRKMFRAVTCFFSPKAVTKAVAKAVAKSRPCHGRGAGRLQAATPSTRSWKSGCSVSTLQRLRCCLLVPA